MTDVGTANYETLNVEVGTDRVCVLTLDRPDNLNAFTVEMANELVDFFTRVNDDDGVGAIIVTGAGRAFCAGMDMAVKGNVFGLDDSFEPTYEDMCDRLNDPQIAEGVRDTGGKVTLAIFDCTKPVIAAINGPAVGIGATMTLPMDIRIASEAARIGFVFGRIGIVPEAASSWFLPRIVGISQALEWVLTADILTAHEAQDGGLVKTVVPGEQLLDEARRLALRIIEKRSPVAIALARQMLWKLNGADHPIEAHRVDSLGVFYAFRGDGREGVRAFREKRDPRYEGKASELPPFYPWWD
jgi:enoyl-CoA hydratase/carnithine racemase